MNPRHLAPDVKLTAELGAVFSAPFERLALSPDWARVSAIALGAVHFLWNDLWTVALLFMVSCAAGDYWAGTKRARLSGPSVYTSTAAHRGLATKVISLGLTLFVRIAEQVVFLMGIGDTKGMLAVVALVGFGIADFRSIMTHREAMGGAPIPLVSAIMARLEGLFGSRVQVTPGIPETPRRREGEV